MPVYRSPDECKAIARAVIVEKGGEPLASFNLNESELNFFRSRTESTLYDLGRRASHFKPRYALPFARPTRNLVFSALATVIAAALLLTGLFYWAPASLNKTPFLTASGAAVVAALTWVVNGSFAHRNTIRQNTNTTLLARYTQAPIGEAFTRFGKAFGFEDDPIPLEKIVALRDPNDDEKWRAAASVGFILNYFELIANGVIRGDLNRQIIQDTIKGSICWYHDRCQAFIDDAAIGNPRVYQQLRRLREYYREN